jgi:hypothetical protein
MEVAFTLTLPIGWCWSSLVRQCCGRSCMPYRRKPSLFYDVLKCAFILCARSTPHARARPSGCGLQCHSAADVPVRAHAVAVWIRRRACERAGQQHWCGFVLVLVPWSYSFCITASHKSANLSRTLQAIHMAAARTLCYVTATRRFLNATSRSGSSACAQTNSRIQRA